MTIFIFIGSLLGLMALGMPIAFALLGCGIALMLHLIIFDAQIIAQNVISGADSFPLMAVPFFMLAGEVMNAVADSRRIVTVALGCNWSHQRRFRLRHHCSYMHPIGVQFSSGGCCSSFCSFGADDGCGWT